MCDCEYEVERDKFAKLLAASGISNADFHAALADFDADHRSRCKDQHDLRTFTAPQRT